MDILDIYDYLPTSFNDIGVWPGDEVCLGPMKSFFAEYYADFIFFSDGNIGPFRVVDIHPTINAIEIMIGDEHILVCNDLIKQFCWN
jgi:hypothetical protein